MGPNPVESSFPRLTPTHNRRLTLLVVVCSNKTFSWRSVRESMPHQNISTPHDFSEGVNGYIPTAHISTKVSPVMLSDLLSHKQSVPTAAHDFTAESIFFVKDNAVITCVVDDVRNI